MGAMLEQSSTFAVIFCGSTHYYHEYSLATNTADEVLASCSSDGCIRLWGPTQKGGETASPWSCIAVLDGHHTRTVRSCSWSPCGRLLASASFDRTVGVWEKVPGESNCHSVMELAAVLEGHENEVKGVAWNPNGTYIATCGRDKTVWIWESGPGNEYEVVDVKQNHTQDVKTVVWHPSGELLASASYDDSIRLWVENDDEWVCTQTIQMPLGHESTVWDIAFTKDGGYMASCSDDKTVRVWKRENNLNLTNTTSQSVLYRAYASLTGHHDRTIYSVGWSVDGYLATGSADNGIKVFSVAGVTCREAEGEEGGEVCDDIVGDDDGHGQRCRLVCSIPEAHCNADVNCVRWHPRNREVLASAGDDGVVKLWRWRC